MITDTTIIPFVAIPIGWMGIETIAIVGSNDGSDISKSNSEVISKPGIVMMVVETRSKMDG